MQNGKVPMFRMKPHYGFLTASIVMLVLGIMIYFQGHSDPGNPDAAQHSNLGLVITIMLSGGFLILATARMWFKHLWHDRYDRKGRMIDRGRAPERRGRKDSVKS
jgi:hypothetical protein